jgi:cell wall-associated NlpC family hydrolase
MQKQYEDLVRKIKAMQRTINSLKGKSVTVSADAKVTIAKQTIAFLRATHTKIPQLASGGPVGGQGGPRSDNQLRWLSPGEFVVNARAAARHRAMLEAINAPRMATGGPVGNKLQRVVNADAAGTAKLGQSAANYLARVVGKTIGKAIDAAVGGGVGGSATIKAFIRAVDRLPYRWGAAGPRAFDCSGLVGAVYGKMRGDPRAGRGARYFTTGSISTRVPGLKPGLGGLLNIGVTAGQGHMAGSYAGLGFEARSTRTGIFTGRAARSPASFARHFHMARGGAVGRLDPGTVAALMGLPGADVGGDAAMTRFAWGRLRRFDRGGWLAPGWNPPMYNGTGRPEPVGGAAGVTVNVTVNGVVATDKERLAAELAGAIHRSLLGYKRGRGNIALGLG